MPKKLPFFFFYPNDWENDSGLNASSEIAQWLWLRMILKMHNSPERGVLLLPSGEVLNDIALSKIVGFSLKRTRTLLQELKRNGVYSERTETDGAIYSRKMVRDEKTRIMKSEAGLKGANARYGHKSAIADAIASAIDGAIAEDGNSHNTSHSSTHSECDSTPLNICSSSYSSLTGKEEKKEIRKNAAMAGAIAEIWNEIPLANRVGRSKYQNAWATVVSESSFNPTDARKAFKDYYASADGIGSHPRQPATLVADRIWNEDPTAWNNGEVPPVDYGQQAKEIVEAREAREADEQKTKGVQPI